MMRIRFDIRLHLNTGRRLQPARRRAG